MVSIFSIELKEIAKAEEAQGKLQSNLLDQKLMRSVLENDQQTIEEGRLIEDAINRGIGGFTPNMVFEKLVKNYQLTKQLMGERMLRLLTGYDPSYIEKNIRIPEFRKELKQALESAVDTLKQKKLLDSEGQLTEKAVQLSSLVLYVQELDQITPKGLVGSRPHKKISHYGEKAVVRQYRKGDRYKDLALKNSIRTAIKRSHTSLHKHDLRTSTRQSKGQLSVVYAIDASASMKGEKLETAKKAGIALAYKAMHEHDAVGLVVFGSDVKDMLEPSQDFGHFLHKIAKVKASKQTDFASMLKKAIELFPHDQSTKHIIILTDALPTKGHAPEEAALKAVSEARSAGITVSLLGIHIDAKGKRFAQQLTRLGMGRLYIATHLAGIDKLLLEDYYSAR